MIGYFKIKNYFRICIYLKPQIWTSASWTYHLNTFIQKLIDGYLDGPVYT